MRFARLFARGPRPSAGAGLLWSAILWIVPWLFWGSPVRADEDAARGIIERAIDRTRGITSHAVLTMRIVRPAWQRETTLETWTRGRDDALIRFTAPARDAGNATLKLGEKMWTFTPKLNRTIRLPYSLMSQSWAGSDFSYDDLSRTDSLLRHYTLALAESAEQDGHQVHTISAVPLADAPIVWGREVLRIRDDDVLLAHTFYDQDQQPVKMLETMQIGELGGRTFGVRVRMHEAGSTDSYTELVWREATFDITLADDHFTLFNLQTSRGSASKHPGSGL